jgi:hypothetical protein
MSAMRMLIPILSIHYIRLRSNGCCENIIADSKPIVKHDSVTVMNCGADHKKWIINGLDKLLREKDLWQGMYYKNKNHEDF